MNSTCGQPDGLEAALYHHFRSYEPDTRFLAQLRRTLIPPAAEVRSSTRPSWHPQPHLRWRYAAVAIVLVLLAAIAAIGPTKVLAQIEQWIGYVPGLGEINLVGTRALVHPVSRTEGDITFSVVEFVASPDQTLVKIHVTGFPADTSLSYWRILVQWEHGNGLRITKYQASPSYPPCPSEGCPAVRQPDGYDLQLAYEPLPADIQQVQLTFNPWGIVPGIPLSEVWSLEIPLEPVTTEKPQSFVQPAYSPRSVMDTHFGVKMTVDRVFADTSRTLIDTSILVPTAAPFASPQGASLLTDTGHLYKPFLFSNDLDLNPIPVQTIPPSTAGGATLTAWPSRWQFAAVNNQASRLTFTVDSIALAYSAQSDFEIELSKDPAVGTVIPLDVSLNIDGFHVHFNQALVVMATSSTQWSSNRVKALEFGIDSPLEVDGRKLTSIDLSHRYYGQDYADPYIDQKSGLTIGRLSLNPALIRNGRMTISVDTVVLELRGPWVLTWDVPREAR
jgi:hypothetical protein